MIAKVSRPALRRVTVTLALLLATGCREALLHELDETRANALILLLEKHGVEAAKERSGALWNVMVSTSDRHRALTVLDHYRIGRGETAPGDSGGGLLQTREERELGLLARIASRLEETVRHIPGVLEARIELAPLQSRAGAELSGARPGRVGALVVAEPSAHVDESSLRSLIAAATGVSPGDVSVVFVQEALAIEPAVDMFALSVSESRVRPIELVAGSHDGRPVQAMRVAIARYRLIVRAVAGVLTFGLCGALLMLRKRRPPVRMRAAGPQQGAGSLFRPKCEDRADVC